MGTNYYVEYDVCPHCGRGEDEKHIGKSSAGWCFSLHVYPDEGINTLEDWEAILKDTVIKNEYGDRVPYEEMLAIIVDRHGGGKYPNPFYNSKEAFNRENHAVDGPNNLSRHRIERHCIGHGEGTWDYIIGDFS